MSTHAREPQYQSRWPKIGVNSKYNIDYRELKLEYQPTLISVSPNLMPTHVGPKSTLIHARARELKYKVIIRQK